MTSRVHLAAIITLASLAGCATTKLSPTHEDVMEELSRRNQLPREQLEQHLSRCASDEQSQFLCASREQVQAELKLELVAADKLRELPGCNLTIERKLERFWLDREDKCGPEAKRTQYALCASAATQRMIKDVLHETRCRAR